MSVAKPDAQIANHLESRLAKTETQIESLTDDVRSLVNVVRQQGDEFQLQMRQLSIAVTTAAGPRKVDWSTIISAIGLIIGIGASALSPLYLRMGDVQDKVEHQQRLIEEHHKLPMHAGGQIRMDFMEKALGAAVDFNKQAVADLDSKLNKQFETAESNLREKVAEIKRTIEEVKYVGSTLTRERLAVIEADLRRLANSKATDKDEIDKLIKFMDQRYGTESPMKSFSGDGEK